MPLLLALVLLSPKRRTAHQNRPQNRRTTHRAAKSNPKKGAPHTKIDPRIGAPHTANQNRAQKRRTAHQKRARKGAPRTKIHPKGHHAPGPRPHIRQVSGSIPPRPSPILVDLVARWLAVPCCCGAAAAACATQPTSSSFPLPSSLAFVFPRPPTSSANKLSASQSCLYTLPDSLFDPSDYSDVSFLRASRSFSDAGLSG